MALPQPLEVLLYRQKRRSITLRLLPGPVGDLRVPVFCSDAMALDFLEKKRPWILRQIGVLAKQPARSAYATGFVCYYLGRPLSLRVLTRNVRKPVVSILEDVLVLEGPETMTAADRHAAIYSWFRARAKDILPDRIEIYGPRMGKMPKVVRIKSLRSKWGSCSSLGAINLRWELIMAPLFVLDYVVIHELAHLHFMHHRPSFWHFVARYCPEYLDAKRWLKNNMALVSLPLPEGAT